MADVRRNAPRSVRFSTRRSTRSTDCRSARPGAPAPRALQRCQNSVRCRRSRRHNPRPARSDGESHPSANPRITTGSQPADRRQSHRHATTTTPRVAIPRGQAEAHRHGIARAARVPRATHPSDHRTARGSHRSRFRAPTNIVTQRQRAYIHKARLGISSSVTPRVRSRVPSSPSQPTRQAVSRNAVIDR